MSHTTATPQPTASTVKRPEVRDQLLQKLQHDLQQAETQARCLKDILDGKVPEKCFDRLDQANYLVDRHETDAQYNHWRGIVDGLKLSIERVQNGDFGTCRTCSKDIELEKLLLSPAAQFCISCQQKQNEASGTRRRHLH